MNGPPETDNEDRLAVEIEMRRQLPVEPAHAFSAWTTPDKVLQWWGPKHVRCTSAEIDLRVGGRYRIGNELPDRSVLWIEGVFEIVEPPHRLEYTWTTSRDGDIESHVAVIFQPHAGGTELILRHRRIPSQALADDHRGGWTGCLDGLAAYLEPAT